MAQNVNLIDLVNEYMADDDANKATQSKILGRLYREASDEVKAGIDAAFICICGYGLDTIIADLHLQLAEG
jgi:hypothetical protein